LGGLRSTLPYLMRGVMEDRKIAYVKWVDSTSYKKLAIDDTAPIDFIETSGIITEEIKGKHGHITLSMNWNHTADHYTESISIPNVAIKRVRRFKIE